MQSAIRLPGTHRVVTKLSGGRVGIYWYRHRGGELMMRFQGDDRAQALAAETAGATALAAAYAEPRSRAEATGATVQSLVTRYKSAPDGLERLAPKTKVDWRRSLDAIISHFGPLPLKALSNRRMKKALVEWRNGFKSTPRQADYHMTVLKRVFSWGVQNGELDANPAEGIAGIYKSNRADKIVQAEQLAAILDKVTPEARLVIRFAAATGLRREDITKIQWSFVQPEFIRFATGKSGGSKTVIVPLFGDAAAVIRAASESREQLLAAGTVPSAFVFVTDRNSRWKPDSLTQAFKRAAAMVGVEERSFNDLRGTAITRFAIAGYTNEQIADIVGWEVERVSNIRKHYVDAATVTTALAHKMAAFEASGPIHSLENPPKTG